jgi:hypothetical protein
MNAMRNSKKKMVIVIFMPFCIYNYLDEYIETYLISLALVAAQSAPPSFLSTSLTKSFFVDLLVGGVHDLKPIGYTQGTQTRK